MCVPVMISSLDIVARDFCGGSNPRIFFFFFFFFYGDGNLIRLSHGLQHFRAFFIILKW